MSASPQFPVPMVGNMVHYTGIDGVVRAAIVAKVHGQCCLNLHVIASQAGDTEAGGHAEVTNRDGDHDQRDGWTWMQSTLAQHQAANNRHR